ncbi:hypothetical protein QJQ45_005081 [Haematococcus lacustris]|nr:hypothetical protein QJQ45_005081 [Haematococcus lacustris]
MGGAIFHHVCQLDKGDKKDAMFYITKKRPHLLLGVIMDSPTTNRAALKILAEQHPTWICITCIVHALNLLCKDLANNSRRSEKHTEVGRVLKEVQQIAKTLGDCHKISSALDTAQLEVYGELRGVSAHIDTRFAILFTICKDIRRSKDALRNMRESGNWAKVSAGSANHACFDVVLDIEWWKRLDAVISLMQPIFNAIQQLEANRPLLSQVMKVWDDLLQWATQWADKFGDPSGANPVDWSFVLGVPRLFRDRAMKHYHPAMAAARYWVLDPINFLPTRHGVQPLPPMKDLTAEQQQDVKLVVARLAQVAPDAAAEELDNFEMGAWDPDMTRVANIILRMTKATEIDGRTVTVIAPAHQRLTWWQVYAQSKFPILAKAAMRLLSVHVSTCAAERNWSAWGGTFADAHRNTLSIEKAEELVFIQANDELTNSNQRDQEKELAIELY